MIYKTKATKVIKIFGGNNFKLNGYILYDYLLFEDRWIDEDDKILYDIKSKPFKILDYKEVHIKGHKLPTVLLEHGSEISEGDILFTSIPIVNIYESRKEIINDLLNE